MIQKKIHRGVFAVMDGTFAGDGPGPRCMVPHVKNVILASADQVAIDAVAAKLMGIDPMSIKFIRLAHEHGLGCGDPREIEIVGDQEAARRELALRRPVQEDDVRVADAAQDLLGPLKQPIEWSLKTVLAPWAYMASVVYHDSFWYPVLAQPQDGDRCCAASGDACSATGRALKPDANGYPDSRAAKASSCSASGMRALLTSIGILGTCIKEAPEFSNRSAGRSSRLRRRAHGHSGPAPH